MSAIRDYDHSGTSVRLLRHHARIAFVAVAVVACSGDDHAQLPAGERDAGVRVRDAGATRHDAGAHPRDAGALVRDAGADRDAGVTRDAGATEPPTVPPPDLVRYLIGAPADREVAPQGPALVLMGGSVEVDAAFEWWRSFVAGGDVVVLRTSGSDGYNDYLYTDIGGVDSVETLLVDSRAHASSAYVAWRVRTAEGVFLAGGDQATYLENWKDTPVQDALGIAWARGAVLGGTSAGLAVLGDQVFAAYNGGVSSQEALTDPYVSRVTLEPDFLDLDPLRGVITDSHFGARDRMGRLTVFLARWYADGGTGPFLGLGVDERTALVVDPAGLGTVMGRGAVYAVFAVGPAARCAPGQTLSYPGLSYATLRAGDTLMLPAGAPSVPSVPLAVEDGVLSPSDPY
ncbi:MAG: cyanophycinase [Deltaproteobacteria bacterium]